MSRALLAIRYLTIVPLSGGAHAGLEDLGGAAPWFPVVGVALGVVIAASDRVTVQLFPPLLAALLTVTLWKVLTGGLHLDGLADCLDGLAGRDPAERRAIMKDSRIGAFGVIGLILFLLLEVAAVSELPHGARWRALVAAPVVGRATPVLLGRVFAPARAGGQGALFSAGLGSAAAPIALAIALGVAVGMLGWLGVAALGVGVAAVVAIGVMLARRLNGVTGDVLGAGVEVAELAVLLTASAWMHAGR